jgi:hypothetical protein
MRRPGKRGGDRLTGFEVEIERYVSRVVRRGGLDSPARLFLAMSIGQAAKGVGCSLAELEFLAGLSKGKVKSALNQFGELGILKLGSTTSSIRTKSQTSFYLPSWWARGRTVERMSGPKVPSYELTFANREIVIQTLESVAERSTADDLLEGMRRKVTEASDSEWRRYLAFSRLLLSDIIETLARARGLYGEFLPNDIELGIQRLFALIHRIEEKCTREQVSALLTDARQVILKPIAS